MPFSQQELALRCRADDEIGVAYAQVNVTVAYQGLGIDTARSSCASARRDRSNHRRSSHAPTGLRGSSDKGVSCPELTGRSSTHHQQVDIPPIE
jgi:hypothetical protein